MEGEYSPVLVVGIGGTGANVLRNIKRRLSIYHNRDKSKIKLLLIDGAPGEQTRGEREVHFTKDEFFLLSDGYNPQVIQKEIDNGNKEYSHIDWVPEEKRFKLPPPGPGMAQTRPVGRLGVFWNYEKLYHKLETVMSSLATYRMPEAPGKVRQIAQVYLVCSVCGGTGSGTFLDIAYIVRHFIDKLKLHESRLTGYLLLPGGFDQVDVDYRMICANAYAALMELEHFMSTKDFDSLYAPEKQGKRLTVKNAPFDVCFLIDGQNELGIPLKHGYRDVAHLLSESIFLRFSSNIGEVIPEASMNLAYERFNGKMKSYGSVGMKGLVMPVEQALRVSGAQVGLSVVRRLLNAPAPREDDIENEIDRFLRRHTLSQTDEDNQLVGLLKAIGHGGSIIRFDTPSGDLDFSNLKIIGTQIRNLLARYHNQNFVEIEQKMKQKAQELSEAYKKTLSAYLSELLDNPESGISHAENFLMMLKARFECYRTTTLKQQTIREDKRKEAVHQLERSLADIEKLGGVIQAIFKRQQDRENECRQRVKEYLTLADKNMGRQLGILARAEAAGMLQKLSDIASFLLERVEELRKTLTKVYPMIKCTAANAAAPMAQGEFSLLLPITDIEDLIDHVKVTEGVFSSFKASLWLNLEGEHVLDERALKEGLLPEEEQKYVLVFPGIIDRLDSYMKKNRLSESAIISFLEEGALPLLRYEKEMLGTQHQPKEIKVLAGPPHSDPLGAAGYGIRTSSAGDEYRLVFVYERYGLPLMGLTSIREYKSAYDIVQEANQNEEMMRALHIFKGAGEWDDPCELKTGSEVPAGAAQ